jgi:hypothetical protein
MNAIQTFGKAFHEQYNRLPVWLPGTEMSVGDVGHIEDGGQFTKLTTLTDLGMDAEVDPGSAKIEYGFASGHGMSSEVGISGSTAVPLMGVPPGTFGVNFQFHDQGSFSMTAAGCTIDRFKDLLSVQAQILDAWNSEARTWESTDWVCVSSVLTAERFALAIAASAGASATLNLDITAPPPGLASASLKADFTSTTDLAWSSVSMTPTPLMYEGWRLHVDWRGRPSGGSVSGVAPSGGPAEWLIVGPVTALY